MDSVRQQKIAGLIQKSFSDILLRESLQYAPGGMITVTNVRVTPDLLVARIYLSIFKSDKSENVIRLFREHKRELRKKLGDLLRFQLRRIPELEFFLDDTLDEVFRLEEIFKQLKRGQDNN